MSHDFQMVLESCQVIATWRYLPANSGRGFKFTPLFGRVLVDLATNGSTYYDISPFSIDRPGIIKTAPCKLPAGVSMGGPMKTAALRETTISTGAENTPWM